MQETPVWFELRRFPGEGNGNPLQYSCLGNPMDRGAWQAKQSMGSQKTQQLVCPLEQKESSDCLYFIYFILETVKNHPFIAQKITKNVEKEKNPSFKMFLSLFLQLFFMCRLIHLLNSSLKAMSTTKINASTPFLRTELA